MTELNWWWWQRTRRRFPSQHKSGYLAFRWFVVLVIFQIHFPTSTYSKSNNYSNNSNKNKSPRTTASTSFSTFDTEDTRVGTSTTSTTAAIITSKTSNNGKETVDTAALPSVTSWVAQYCSKSGNEFYSEVPLSFIKDPVTTATICDSIDSPFVDDAIKLINGDVSDPADLCSTKREATAINALAEHLYDLLHGRYIITYEGLRSVRLKHEQGVYGQCPRVFCRGHPLLPVGLHDRAKESTVKCFCPKCRDIYHPPSLRHRRTDSAAFGTTLPHLLLQRMPEVSPVRPKDHYVPRIFGFEIHESATEMAIYRKGVGVRGVRDRGASLSGKGAGTTTAGTESEVLHDEEEDDTILGDNDELP